MQEESWPGGVQYGGKTGKEPKKTKINNFYYGISEGISYEFFKGVRGKFSLSHNVRLPDTEELFGDGVTVSLQLI